MWSTPVFLLRLLWPPITCQAVSATLPCASSRRKSRVEMSLQKDSFIYKYLELFLKYFNIGALVHNFGVLCERWLPLRQIVHYSIETMYIYFIIYRVLWNVCNKSVSTNEKTLSINIEMYSSYISGNGFLYCKDSATLCSQQCVIVPT